MSELNLIDFQEPEDIVIPLDNALDPLISNNVVRKVHCIYGENKCIKSRSSHLNGKLDGVSETWNEASQMTSKLYFRYGEKHGIQRQWYPSGQLRVEEEFHAGVKHGIHNAWSKSGDVKFSKAYNNGVLVSCREGECCVML
jgi:antitoxin component YwqK of YwqJK toxin-antitoxin module